MIEVNPVLGYADSYRMMARMADAEGKPRTVEIFSVITDLERNIAPLITAAQSELAALREELANAESDNEVIAEHNIELQQCLTAAEQRNAELIALLEHAYGAINENDGWKELCARILAVVQPAESGASE